MGEVKGHIFTLFIGVITPCIAVAESITPPSLEWYLGNSSAASNIGPMCVSRPVSLSCGFDCWPREKKGQLVEKPGGIHSLPPDATSILLETYAMVIGN